MRTWLRADLLIAVCALLISSLTCVATFFQTRVVANQLSASVWPYLSYTTTFDPNGITMTIDNDGLGPAVIRSASLEVDGREMASWEAAAKSLGKIPGIKGIGGSFTSLGPGSVIREGASHQLFHLQFTTTPRADRAAALTQLRDSFGERAAVTVCYCSTLENCWLLSTGRDQQPVEVGHCSEAKEIGA
jgi:hypothetical protein